ncbi:MAG: YceD family protein [Steroidobacteraceae bacterium]
MLYVFWSKPLDVDRLAHAEVMIDFDVPLAELPRLKARIAGIGGSVHGVARFGRQSRFAVVELSLTGKATLQCQRCMQAMELPVDGTTHVALILAEADAADVPGDLEPVLAREGRISAGELVEEELLLALPIVPLHEDLRACAVATSAPLVAQQAPEPVTQRPFAGLDELLRHK